MNLELLRAIVAHPQDLVLCTVLRVRGSAPRHAGSKMLVGREGRLLGSVGGGRGEALALAEAALGLAAEVLRVELRQRLEAADMKEGGLVWKRAWTHHWARQIAAAWNLPLEGA